MPRLNAAIVCLLLVIPVLGCVSREPLRDLPLDEQREIGEAAMAAVCVAQVDVESHITLRQRETLSVAREYIDIASGAVSVGELSQFFSAQTLATCGPNATEWGGVRAAVAMFVHRYGTEAEVMAHVQQVSSPDLYCAEIVPYMEEWARARHVSACDELGLPTRPPTNGEEEPQISSP